MDRYQQDVEYLTKNPRHIYSAWASGGEDYCHPTPGSSLFRFAYNRRHRNEVHGVPGCLTMLRNGMGDRVAQTEELTRAIASDTRLPKLVREITIDHLPIFAGWQRRIDQETGRQAPPLHPLLPTPIPELLPAASHLPSTIAIVAKRRRRRLALAAVAGSAILFCLSLAQIG